MKKYVLILLAVLSIFVLTACKDDEVINDTAITAEFTEAEINQNSITVKLTVDDPDDEITGTIYARLYDEDDNAVSSRSFTKSTTDDYALDEVTITFAALGLEQTYTIDVVVTVDRDTITVEEYTFQTIGEIHITTVEEFLAMDDYRGADYILDNDLDFSGVEFVSPFASVYFSGTFDGQGYTLSNIEIKTSRSDTDLNNNYYYIGVFGYLSSSALVENLVLDGITIGSETEPQILDNASRIGFFAGYVASSSVEINNITVKNSHMNVSTTSDDYIIAGGLVGELKGEFTGGTIINSSMEIETTAVQTDSKYLVRTGGAVGYLQPDGELHEVNAEIDVTYHTNISEFADEEGLKVAVGGVIGENNAINTADSVTDVIAVGDINVNITIALADEFESGSYAVYVGGLVGYSSTKITDGFFAGSIDVVHLSQDSDLGVNKQIYVGGLFGYYGVSKASEQIVWINDGEAITIDTAADANLHVGSLMGYESKTPAHIYGVTSAENVVINTVAQAATAPVIASMTDYFSSEYANDAYGEFILG